MGTLYQSLRRWFGAVGSTGQQAGIQYGEPFTRVNAGSAPTPDYGIDGSLQLSAVWAAIELLTDNIASLPIYVYKKNVTNNPMGYKDLARGGALWLLMHDSPNRRHTPMEFWQYMTMNFLFRGNAYARLIRGDNGEVIEMWPLSADQVEVEVLPDRAVIYKYIYEGKIAVYSEDSILHWRDKGNGIVGMSRLDYMRQTVALGVSAQNHSSNTFSKGGKRPGVFMLDKMLNKKQRDQIRDNFSELVEGADTDLLVLEAGAKFEPLSMSPVDLQLDTTRRYTVEEVARWFGISSVLINDTAKTTTWGTGIEQLIEGFYKFRLRPLLVSLEQAIQRRVFTANQRARYEIEFGMDALLRSSLKDRMEIYAKATQNGIYTRNEARQWENLPPIPGGDKLTAQTNLTPVDKLGTMPTSGAQNGTTNQDPVAQ